MTLPVTVEEMDVISPPEPGRSFRNFFDMHWRDPAIYRVADGGDDLTDWIRTVFVIVSCAASGL